MPNLNINLGSFNLSCLEKVYVPLMVCSHERSGTHFMMNGLSTCTEYTKDPYLDFDYCTLGPIVNFFWTEGVNNFLNSLTNIKIKNKNDIYCAKNILKSHYSLKILGEKYKGNCKIVYIYRNPKDVFISYWKFLNNWKWFEGPKLKSPLELMALFTKPVCLGPILPQSYIPSFVVSLLFFSSKSYNSLTAATTASTRIPTELIISYMLHLSVPHKPQKSPPVALLSSCVERERRRDILLGSYQLLLGIRYRIRSQMW